LYASKAYLKKYGTPESPKDLSKHQIVIHINSKKAGLILSDGKMNISFGTAARLVVDDFETIKKMISLGEGVGWLPSFVAEADNELHDLVQILPRWRLNFASTFSFVYPGQQFAAPKVRAFIELATEMIKDMPV
jgi:DNA-binding transcriptional LysR family regulator